MTWTLIEGDCLEVDLPKCQCLFADPPDNIGLKYGVYVDRRDDYFEWVERCLDKFTQVAPIIWWSFNSKWSPEMGAIVAKYRRDFEIKHCVQTFTFGQHKHSDLGNHHRPLYRLRRPHAPLYPDAIRVLSVRQMMGDKRADPRGRVPGDVFDFPRVTGNSYQRRKWHNTQLNEGLVERCIKLSTKPGDLVIDPFAGTGTTLRVCRRLERSCVTVELDPDYCEQIRYENGLD